MKTKKMLFSSVLTTLFLMFFVTLESFALDYTITFTGSGASTSVGSVIVQNLTKGTTVTVSAGNTLNLTDGPSAINQLGANDETISIYPNLIQGKSTLSFYAKQAGITQINIFGIDGKRFAGLSLNLQEGKNSFLLSLPKGAFVINVTGIGYAYSAKTLNQISSERKTEIDFLGNNKMETTGIQKSKSAVTAFGFATGDRLLYKGISGNFATIVTDIPTASKTTNFEFVECKDADGNYYSVVKIGTQTWMAENLKTTKYRNNEAITNITVAADWTGTTTGAWCDYNNDVANGTKYGHLYNWFAASDSRNIAPLGWHVSNDNEWNTFASNLGGVSAAGGKLKETGLTNWVNPNRGATNESGFRALPGGYRLYIGGAFGYVNNYGYWWNSTEAYTTKGWGRLLSYENTILGVYSYEKNYGFSIRCVKD